MARAYFIYGCPQESRQTIKETTDLIERIKPLSTVFYILDIFPGTRLYEDFKQRLQQIEEIENKDRIAADLYQRALSRFLKFQDNKDAVRFAALCYESLGDHKNEAAMQKLFDRME